MGEGNYFWTLNPGRHPLRGLALGYYLSPLQGFGLNSL
jgi:hypothetical protein